MNLNDQLKDALKREDPPEGFAERVMRRASQQAVSARRIRRETKWHVPKWHIRWMWPAAAFAGIGAVVLSISVSVSGENRRRQEEWAGRQAILALQIAAEHLNRVQNEVNK